MTVIHNVLWSQQTSSSSGKPTDIIRLSFFLSFLLACLLACFLTCCLQGQSLSTEELQLHVLKRYNNLIMLGTLLTHILTLTALALDQCFLTIRFVSHSLTHISHSCSSCYWSMLFNTIRFVSYSLTHILTLAALAIDQCFLTQLDLWDGSEHKTTTWRKLNNEKAVAITTT
jgi:hypothetical protein